MRGRKNTNAVLITVVVLLLALVAAMLFVLLRYHIVDFKLYAKDSTVLDLTQEQITVEHMLDDCIAALLLTANPNTKERVFLIPVHR